MEPARMTEILRDQNVHAIRAEIDRLNRHLLDAMPPDELGLLNLLGDLRECRTLLAQVESIVEAEAAKAMTGDLIEAPGLLARRRTGATRKAWDHARVWGRVEHHAVVSLAFDESGTLDEDRAEIAKAAVAFAAEAANPSWRVTALKRMGIRYDDACETTPGRRTVEVIRGEEAVAAAKAE